MSTVNPTKIAKNTIALYLRMALGVVIGLYTSRVLLNELGATDYGLFNVVGGLISMLGFINMALSSSTQRFLNYNQDKVSRADLQKIFSTSINLHLIVATIIVILLETVGLWFVYNKLNIPKSQFDAAVIVYHISVLSCFLGILQTPYSAAINAHERMNVFAYFSLLDLMLRLLIVLALRYVESNKLVLYANLCLMVSITMRMIYYIYCKRNFEECRYIFVWDKTLLKQMCNFSGWMIWGCVSALLSTQGVTILLNIFCGPVINAARALAGSAQGVLSQFSGNILAACRPQITRNYNDKHLMNKLVSFTTRSTLFMMFIPAISLLIYTPVIVKLWLGNVPEYTVIFIRLLIVDTLLRGIFEPIAIVNNAGGKIKWYQLSITILYILQFIFSYIALKAGGSPASPYLVIVLISFLGIMVRCYIVQKIDGLSMKEFIRHTITPVLKVTLSLFIGGAALYFTLYNPANSVIILIINIIILSIFSSLCCFLLGFSLPERNRLSNNIRNIYRKYLCF